MKPLRARLEEARSRLGTPWEVLERDYLLSWVLAGISRVQPLRAAMVFKGGTALKKCYFGDYRFSEDLDFSGLPGVPTGDAMESAVRQAATRRQGYSTSTPRSKSTASAMPKSSPTRAVKRPSRSVLVCRGSARLPRA